MMPFCYLTNATAYKPYTSRNTVILSSLFREGIARVWLAGYQPVLRSSEALRRSWADRADGPSFRKPHASYRTLLRTAASEGEAGPTTGRFRRDAVSRVLRRYPVRSRHR